MPAAWQYARARDAMLPHAAFFGRLVERLEANGVPPHDPVFAAARAARDAVHQLNGRLCTASWAPSDPATDDPLLFCGAGI